MVTNDKIIKIFCATDKFSKKYEEEIENMPLLSSEGKVRRRRAASMSDSEIMTILIMFHFGNQVRKGMNASNLAKGLLSTISLNEKFALQHWLLFNKSLIDRSGSLYLQSS